MTLYEVCMKCIELCPAFMYSTSHFMTVASTATAINPCVLLLGVCTSLYLQPSPQLEGLGRAAMPCSMLPQRLSGDQFPCASLLAPTDSLQ